MYSWLNHNGTKSEAAIAQFFQNFAYSNYQYNITRAPFGFIEIKKIYSIATVSLWLSKTRLS